MKKTISTTCAVVAVSALLFSLGASAREYPIGGPVITHDMEIASSYLVGIDMAPMPPGMVRGPTAFTLKQTFMPPQTTNTDSRMVSGFLISESRIC